METFMFLSISIEELETVIKKCVNECLLNLTLEATSKEDTLLTVKEASEYVNLGVTTLYAMAQRRQIPFSKVSRKLYFSKFELAEWIKSGRHKTNAEVDREILDKASSKSSKNRGK